MMSSSSSSSRSNSSDCFSKHLIKNIELLHFLSNSPLSTQKAIISSCEPDLIASLIEISANLLAGKIVCSPEEKRKLRKYRKELRELAVTCELDSSCKKQRQLIVNNRRNQKGGNFLSILLPPALEVISSILELQ